jgi:sugar phosphate isomerase/epimerase
MGIASTSFYIAAPRDTYEYLEKCAALGAGGIQHSLSSLEPAYLKKLRGRAEELGMYVELMASPQRDNFPAVIAAAQELGALYIRGTAPGPRRYEAFPTYEAWKKAAAEAQAAIERNVRVLEKHKITLALENHRDYTVEEIAKLLRSFNNEYVRCCVDFGNNLALLDDPMETVETLAPFAASTHLKDAGLKETPDGFLLADIPLGAGILPLKQMMAVIMKANPKVRMSLEMMTRDATATPALTDRYHAVMPGRSGLQLARTLRLARERTDVKMPEVSRLDKEAKLKREEDNVRKSFEYARAELGL